jgi:hypothetical protein
VALYNYVSLPVISAVAASSISAAGATITWTTDTASDTQVEYGPTTTYGSSTPLATILVTAHTQALSGLAPNTVYHYRVRSGDGTGNVAVSADFAFTTPAALPSADVVVPRALRPITVDGSLTEWSGAAVTFSGLSNSATVSLQWDATNLYVAFQVTDMQLSAIQSVRDAAGLWADDTVEVYLDTLGDRATSMQPVAYQFMVNLNNAQVDFRGAKGWKDLSWNGTWMSAVSRQGSLNDHGDSDSGYVVEIVIPWAQLGVTPVSGQVLGMNLVVNDSDPAGSVAFNTFNWAGMTAPYARPNLWKRIQLTK